jgi:Kef-type K+ transport system membrane component KefB
MPQVSFSSLLLVVLIAFLAPLLLAAAPRLHLPEPVVLIGAGIGLGPSGLGLVESDVVVGVLALIGLAFLLFLAGAEIDLRQLRGSEGWPLSEGC